MGCKTETFLKEVTETYTKYDCDDATKGWTDADYKKRDMDYEGGGEYHKWEMENCKAVTNEYTLTEWAHCDDAEWVLGNSDPTMLLSPWSSKYHFINKCECKELPVTIGANAKYIPVDHKYAGLAAQRLVKHWENDL